MLGLNLEPVLCVGVSRHFWPFNPLLLRQPWTLACLGLLLQVGQLWSAHAIIKGFLRLISICSAPLLSHCATSSFHESLVMLLPSLILFPLPLPYPIFGYCLILGQYIICFCPCSSNLAQSFGSLEPSCLQYFAHCGSPVCRLISWCALCSLLLLNTQALRNE